MIGAHPDDEDTHLLTYLVQHDGADAAYLTLTRGEGGQNLIGEELGIELGLLRSGELAAARAVDGARQYVTRAYDFGYTRSLDETQRFWSSDSILKDVVRIVRRFRPHVVVSVFSGTPRDGHGQHQMAGVVAAEAFAAAGDPGRFGDLATEEGLAPWQPVKLYRSTRFDSTANSLEIETGGVDPRTGRTYHQMAMESRSQHRSQDMGQLQEVGGSRTRVALVRDLTGAGDGALFAGVAEEDAPLARFADSLRGTIAPARLAEATAPLVTALERTARDDAGERDRRLLERAVAISAGLMFDARASAEQLVPGDTVTVALRLYNGGRDTVAVEQGSVRVPAGWEAHALDTLVPLPPGGVFERAIRVAVPPDAAPLQPYFLARPMAGALYDWSAAPPSLRGELLDPPLLEGVLIVRLRPDAVVHLTREATYRYNDQGSGEVRRPLRVVPLLEVALEPELLVVPAAAQVPRTVTVTLTYHGRGPLEGAVALEGIEGSTPPRTRFSVSRAGERATETFPVPAPRDVQRRDYRVRAVARPDGGREYDSGVRVIGYPHVRAAGWVRPARGELRVAPMVLPRLRAVGYVRGAADRVPEALTGLGLPVEVLTADQLARGNLSRFDVIVIGSRAYETDSALARHNDRLLAYVRGGGRLIVQYQQYQFARGNFAPYPLGIAVPNDRVTDETAPVTVLVARHPIFTFPNAIGPEDWQGWPQERGLYFARPWDERYTPLLEMADPGQSPMRGALLVTHVGQGTYVYTGLSFFRALPAAVPGATRLFLNLLAWHGRDGS